MVFVDLLNKRKSTRKFVPGRVVEWKKIIDLVEAGIKIPLAGNIPVINFIFVNDKDKILEVSEACAQPFISDASALLVVCSQKDQLVRNFEKSGETFAHQESGAAINNVLLATTEAGLSSCWIGHFSDRIIKRMFKIPKNVFVEAIIAIGYEAPLRLGDKQKVHLKPKIENSVFYDEWDKNKRE